ncbi:hypothetical protein CBL_20404 [Carabus blaptoides fortunei]
MKNRGGFSDTTPPMNSEERPRRLVGLGVHQQKVHRDWYDAAQMARRPPKKVRWTDEELSIVAEEEARSRTLGLKPNWRKISALIHRTEEALKSQRRSVRYKATLLKLSTSTEPDKEAPPSPEPHPTPPTDPYSSPGALKDTPSDDTLLRREIITTIQALVATHTDINPTIRRPALPPPSQTSFLRRKRGSEALPVFLAQSRCTRL